MALSRRQACRKQGKQIKKNREKKEKKSLQLQETNGKKFSVHVLRDNCSSFS